jgi:hypothetical protein
MAIHARLVDELVGWPTHTDRMRSEELTEAARAASAFVRRAGSAKVQ